MTELMLVRVSEVAVEQGLPLTSREKCVLASQILPGAVDAMFEKRMMDLISEAMQREAPPEAGRLDRDFRLADALKYVGEKRDWPYIAQLVEVVRKSGLSQQRRWTSREWFKDKSLLLAYVVLVILGLVAIAAVLNLLGVLR